MELKIKHTIIEEEKNKVLGSWHTEISLRAKGWDES